MPRSGRNWIPLVMGAVVGLVAAMATATPAAALCAKTECDIWNGWCLSSSLNLKCTSSSGFCSGSSPCLPT